MGSAQFGKTLIAKAIHGYYIHQAPTPMLHVQPTVEMAETFSKDRLSPMIRDTPVLRPLIDDRTRKSGNTILHKSFPGGHITMVGANSPSSLAGRPVGVVVFDEPGRYPASTGAEGNPCDLGERRTDGFPNPLSIYMSTPTIVGDIISEKFKVTDQRKFFVPCTHCGFYQTLEWENIKYDIEDGEIKNTSYQCCECQELIPESHKPRMLIAGEWRATARSKRPGFVGFYINSLYSPFKTWTDRAYIYEESKGNAEKFQVFWNTILGRVWEQKGESPDWEKIYGRRESYQRNRVPSGGSIILAGADVQHDRIEVEIKAYGPDMESWSIDYRILVGDVKKPEIWAQMDDLMREEFPYEDGGVGKIYRLGIDTGDGTTTTIVYRWARKWGPDRVMAAKGSSQRMAPIVSRPKLIDRDSRGNQLEGGVYLWMVGTDVAKSEIYSALRSMGAKDKQFGRMHFPDYDEGYFQSLTIEQLVPQIRGGSRRMIWVNPPGGRNEKLDCNVYCRATAASVGVDRWTDFQHQKYLDKWIRQNRPKEAQRTSRRKVGRGIVID